jgi:hypothetical protein
VRTTKALDPFSISRPGLPDNGSMVSVLLFFSDIRSRRRLIILPGEVVQGFDIAQKMHNLATTNYASKSESPSRFYVADVFTISECGLA